MPPKTDSPSYTPGPWHIYFDEPFDRDRPTYKLEDQAGHQLSLIARLPEVDVESFKKDCLLIAAAPEMYEALEAQLGLNGHTRYCSIINRSDRREEYICVTACEKLRTILKRARGEDDGR